MHVFDGKLRFWPKQQTSSWLIMSSFLGKFIRIRLSQLSSHCGPQFTLDTTRFKALFQMQDNRFLSIVHCWNTCLVFPGGKYLHPNIETYNKVRYNV